MTDIVLVNQTSLGDALHPPLPKVAAAFQTMFDRDFEPVWKTGLAVKFSVSTDGTVPSGALPLYFQDHTPVPGAGGFHQDDTGTPQGFVFVADALAAGESWTVDGSHEAFEMIADPTTDVIIPLPGMPGYSCLREVGDAVEADQFGYMIDDVLVTDWCTPLYFYGTDHAGPADAYDFRGHLTKPAPALLDGGYLGIRDPDGNWSQVSDFVKGQLSRRARRTMGRLNRMARR